MGIFVYCFDDDFIISEGVTSELNNENSKVKFI